jgi:hypothetical protein
MVNENNCKIQGFCSTNQEFQGFPWYFQGSKDFALQGFFGDFLGQKSFISQKILGILGILGFYNGFLHVPSEILGILGNNQGILGTVDLLSEFLGFYSCFR